MSQHEYLPRGALRTQDEIEAPVRPTSPSAISLDGDNAAPVQCNFNITLTLTLTLKHDDNQSKMHRGKRHHSYGAAHQGG